MRTWLMASARLVIQFFKVPWAPTTTWASIRVLLHCTRLACSCCPAHCLLAHVTFRCVSPQEQGVACFLVVILCPHTIGDPLFGGLCGPHDHLSIYPRAPAPHPRRAPRLQLLPAGSFGFLCASPGLAAC